MRRIGAERTVVVVEHDMTSCGPSRPSVTVLARGKVIADAASKRFRPTRWCSRCTSATAAAADVLEEA
ncbi:hypothetical protein GS416_03655 [Rhodococcus hoagii]|nr:hypothetical protein [Prescottella equi]